MIPANPFSVQTPEGLSASAMCDLFVNVFSDFQSVPLVGHTFLHGPRGSGKSMMFRYMEPDCQMLAEKRQLNELDYLGVYFPVKASSLQVAELQRLNIGHVEIVLNEHLLTLNCAIKLFTSLSKAIGSSREHCIIESLEAAYEDHFREQFTLNGWDDFPSLTRKADTADDVLNVIISILIKACTNLMMYLRRLSFNSQPVPYLGPLCGYLDFLLPIVQVIRKFTFVPQGPVYLLIDDADNLSLSHTQILNSWVSCRTTTDVSLKISTQLNYKTYLTHNGQVIRSPHDFSEVSIADVYTSRRSHYSQQVKAIVERRLKSASISKSPEEFFPAYEKQEEEINRIAEEIKLRWESELEKRGNRSRDDAYRYARPVYMTNLSGSRKAGSKYKYAGFQQLVDISSGIIRYFLEAASSMYAEASSIPSAASDATATTVNQIDPDIQDRIIRKLGENFLFNETVPGSDQTLDNAPLSDLQKLKNLVNALGGAFGEILRSDRSERRIFSFALSDQPTPELKGILRRGVELGFFHEGTIGNKEGTGRTRLYILSRRLAPVFKLDPTSFAGYQFVTCAKLTEAMYKPISFVRRTKRKGPDSSFEDAQPTLFRSEEEG
jgi:hypothetical protein